MIPGKTETDESYLLPRRFSRAVAKSRGDLNRDQGSIPGLKRQSSEYREAKEARICGEEYLRGSCTERMQRVPSNLAGYSVTSLACMRGNCPGPGKEPIDQIIP